MKSLGSMLLIAFSLVTFSRGGFSQNISLLEKIKAEGLTPDLKEELEQELIRGKGEVDFGAGLPDGFFEFKISGRAVTEESLDLPQENPTKTDQFLRIVAFYEPQLVLEWITLRDVRSHADTGSVEDSIVIDMDFSKKWDPNSGDLKAQPNLVEFEKNGVRRFHYMHPSIPKEGFYELEIAYRPSPLEGIQIAQIPLVLFNHIPEGVPKILSPSQGVELNTESSDVENNKILFEDFVSSHYKSYEIRRLIFKVAPRKSGGWHSYKPLISDRWDMPWGEGLKGQSLEKDIPLTRAGDDLLTLSPRSLVFSRPGPYFMMVSPMEGKKINGIFIYREHGHILNFSVPK